MYQQVQHHCWSHISSSCAHPAARSGMGIRGSRVKKTTIKGKIQGFFYIYVSYEIWGGKQLLREFSKSKPHQLWLLSHSAPSSLSTEEMQTGAASFLCHLNIKMTRQSLIARLKHLSIARLKHLPILLVLLEQFRRQIWVLGSSPLCSMELHPFAAVLHLTLVKHTDTRNKWVYIGLGVVHKCTMISDPSAPQGLRVKSASNLMFYAYCCHAVYTPECCTFSFCLT